MRKPEKKMTNVHVVASAQNKCGKKNFFSTVATICLVATPFPNSYRDEHIFFYSFISEVIFKSQKQLTKY